MDEETRPWRTDPLIAGRGHPDYPDDIQVIVHDGGPRFTDSDPELVWVTILATDGIAYRAKVLNQPVGLESVQQGDEILFLAVANSQRLGHRALCEMWLLGVV
jgi:hypothetical protein